MSLCRRCGLCCLKGGPVLHLEDLPLIGRGVLAPAALVTLRAGELARDPVRDTLAPLSGEVIKIAGRAVEKGGWACALFNAGDNSCSVHADRPAQCRALFCDAPEALVAMYERDRLRRADVLALFHPDGPALAEAHESVCSLPQLVPIARCAADDPTAAETLLETLRFDKAFRELAVERAGLTPEVLQLFFGRPLTSLLPDFGLGLEPPGRLVRSGRCMY